MWSFLRSGRTGVEAVSHLEDLIQELERAQGSLSSDPVVAANRYLIWTERAEEELVATFQGSIVPRELHSERYWRIRSGELLVNRPMPLIKAEMKAQKRYLEGLLDQLKHYISMLCLPPDHWIIVPDTNVYIHGRMFHEVEWHREMNVKQATLVMPLVVLDELDRIKDRDSDFGRYAGVVLRALDNVTSGKDWLAPIRMRARVTLQLVNEPLGHVRRKGNDDEIVRQAGYFAQLNEGRLVLLTRDRGMRVRTQASGLIGKYLPDNLVRTGKTL